ncbi:hypothetical protein Hte_010859 [Hypoxylon texense]
MYVVPSPYHRHATLGHQPLQPCGDSPALVVTTNLWDRLYRTLHGQHVLVGLTLALGHAQRLGEEVLPLEVGPPAM